MSGSGGDAGQGGIPKTRVSGSHDLARPGGPPYGPVDGPFTLDPEESVMSDASRSDEKFEGELTATSESEGEECQETRRGGALYHPVRGELCEPHKIDSNGSTGSIAMATSGNSEGEEEGSIRKIE